MLLFASFYVCVELKGGETNEIIFGFLVVYTHFSTVVVSGIYFYGSLLFGYDFYYFLNRKLKNVLRNVEFKRKSRRRIENYCQACDELDKLSLVYSRINVFIGRINRLSVVQITGELLGSFVMITSAVSNTVFSLIVSKLYS